MSNIRRTIKQFTEDHSVQSLLVNGYLLYKIFLLSSFTREVFHLDGPLRICFWPLVSVVAAFVLVQVNDNQHHDRKESDENHGDNSL